MYTHNNDLLTLAVSIVYHTVDELGNCAVIRILGVEARLRPHIALDDNNARILDVLLELLGNCSVHLVIDIINSLSGRGYIAVLLQVFKAVLECCIAVRPGIEESDLIVIAQLYRQKIVIVLHEGDSLLGDLHFLVVVLLGAYDGKCVRDLSLNITAVLVKKTPLVFQLDDTSA